ncbi:uncharacterized protein LOC142483126 [Ascaphus truei]|uniref:uncharacterized protein LOC142483126 n=1 Tax=Ascaphus truei TaxID=8439 RepID=UPI003F5A0CBF
MSLMGDLGDMEDSDLLDFLLDERFPCEDLLGGYESEAPEWWPLEKEMLIDPEDFLSELLGSSSSLSSSPPASDSGISEDQAALPSPGTWDPSPLHSPNIMQSDHNYSLLQESDGGVLQSVRSETCEGDVLIDLGIYVQNSDRELGDPISLCMEEEEEEDDEEEEVYITQQVYVRLEGYAVCAGGGVYNTAGICEVRGTRCVCRRRRCI